MQSVLDRWDQVSLLVNNASVYDPVPFAQIDAEEWDRVQAINLRAPFLLSRGLLPAMQRRRPRVGSGRRRGNGRSWCKCATSEPNNPRSFYTHYSVSKAGLVMLVKAMALELAPGSADPGNQSRPGGVAARLPGRQAPAHPGPHPVGNARALPEDVATLIRYLTLEGHYLNGAIIPVDGGLGKRY